MTVLKYTEHMLDFILCGLKSVFKILLTPIITKRLTQSGIFLEHLPLNDLECFENANVQGSIQSYWIRISKGKGWKLAFQKVLQQFLRTKKKMTATNTMNVVQHIVSLFTYNVKQNKSW